MLLRVLLLFVCVLYFLYISVLPCLVLLEPTSDTIRPSITNGATAENLVEVARVDTSGVLVVLVAPTHHSSLVDDRHKIQSLSNSKLDLLIYLATLHHFPRQVYICARQSVPLLKHIEIATSSPSGNILITIENERKRLEFSTRGPPKTQIPLLLRLCRSNHHFQSLSYGEYTLS